MGKLDRGDIDRAAGDRPRRRDFNIEMRNAPWKDLAFGLFYLLIALLCFLAWRGQSGEKIAHPASSAPWMVGTISLLLLCINQQFQLQLRLTNLIRASARSDGWYHRRRRQLQGLLMASSILAGAAMLWGSLALLRNSNWASRVAIAGLVYLVSLVLIRAPSMHEVDRLFYRPRRRVGNIRLITLLDSAGLIAIGLAAILVSAGINR